MTNYIGCDLGGTNIKVGVVDIQAGEVIHSRSIPTESQSGHQSVLSRIAGLADSLIEESGIPRSDIAGMGVSLPGMLDLAQGKTIFLTNFPGHWRDVPVADYLHDQLDLPVSILNDARAITYGEYHFGAGKGVDRLACYTIGTGIGGGLIIDGELLLGFDGSAGELGHQTLDIHGPRCGCGNKGCLETFASGPAIASMGEKAVRQGLTTNIGEFVDYDLNKISPKILARAAESGDKIAQEIWDQAGHYLGTGIANVLVTVGPQLVILAGGVAQAGTLLLDPVRQAIQDRVYLMPKEKVEITLGKLGRDAGILGMAMWAAKQQE